MVRKEYQDPSSDPYLLENRDSDTCFDGLDDAKGAAHGCTDDVYMDSVKKEYGDFLASLDDKQRQAVSVLNSWFNTDSSTEPEVPSCDGFMLGSQTVGSDGMSKKERAWHKLIDKLEKKLVEKQSDLKRWKKSAEELADTHSAEVEQLNQVIVRNAKEYKALKLELSTLQEKYLPKKELEALKKTYEEENNGLKSELESAQKSFEKETEDLKSELEYAQKSFERENSDLKSVLETTEKKLQRENNDLKAELKSTKKKFEVLNNDLQFKLDCAHRDFEKEKIALQAKLDLAQKEFEKENNDLKSKLESAQEEIRIHQESRPINKWKARVATAPVSTGPSFTRTRNPSPMRAPVRDPSPMRAPVRDSAQEENTAQEPKVEAKQVAEDATVEAPAGGKKSAADELAEIRRMMAAKRAQKKNQEKATNAFTTDNTDFFSHSDTNESGWVKFE